ncbi:hypothetical protein ACVW0I_003176 [Bradyrhizobium sp. LM6.11]
MSGHPVELIAERLQLVAGLDREPQAEVAALDPPRALRSGSGSARSCAG